MRRSRQRQETGLRVRRSVGTHVAQIAPEPQLVRCLSWYCDVHCLRHEHGKGSTDEKVVVCTLYPVAGRRPVRCGGRDARVDVRRGVPDDVYLVVYGKHNPERDYQRKYYEEVWKTVQETKIIDRVIKIVTSRDGQRKRSTRRRA